MFIQFKEEMLNIAVVLDEYGGLAGIVTLEDVIEEILGDLYDENEMQESNKITRIDHNHYRIAANVSLHQLNEWLGIKLPPRKYAKTLGGYLVEAAGHIPHTDEVLELPAGIFKVEKVKRNRITTVTFTPKDRTQQSATEEGRQ
jgi:CBS domain containing-hemolysin-like protein